MSAKKACLKSEAFRSTKTQTLPLMQGMAQPNALLNTRWPDSAQPKKLQVNFLLKTSLKFGGKCTTWSGATTCRPKPMTP